MKKQLSLILGSLLSVMSLSAQAGMWDDVKATAAEGWEATKEGASDVASGVKEAVTDEDNQAAAKSMWESVKSDASDAWEATKEGAGTVVESVTESSKEGVEGVKEWME